MLREPELAAFTMATTTPTTIVRRARMCQILNAPIGSVFRV